MNLKINADYDSRYAKDVSQVYYQSTKFSLEFEEDVTITLSSEQFENLLRKMYDTYVSVAGVYEAEKLVTSEESEVV